MKKCTPKIVRPAPVTGRESAYSKRPGCPMGRRAFIKGAAGAVLTGAVLARSRGKAAAASQDSSEKPLSWKNWSGSVTCSPQAIARPDTEEALVELIQKAEAENWSVRLTGSGHSFMPLCASDGVVASIAEMRGVISTDPEKRQATVWGGTKIQQLHEPLRAAGLAMENISDIDRQAITGAIATGTHGTGHGIRSISNQVVALRLATASGEIVDCSPEQDPELFKAAQVSLGALGVVTQVTLQLMPTYRLHEKVWRASFEECYENLDDLVHNNRHFEFFWVSQTDACLIKTLNITERMPDDLPDLEGERIGHSDVIFPSVRSMRFNEIEFSLPEEHGPECLRELRALLKDKYPKVTMPLEYRTVGADDVFLSMAQGRETVTISAHELGNRPYETFFADVEAIFRSYGGRPHWGKIHTHTAEDLEALYPMWNRFQTVRKRIDPDGRFMNDHLRALFG